MGFQPVLDFGVFKVASITPPPPNMRAVDLPLGRAPNSCVKFEPMAGFT